MITRRSSRLASSVPSIEGEKTDIDQPPKTEFSKNVKPSPKQVTKQTNKPVRQESQEPKPSRTIKTYERQKRPTEEADISKKRLKFAAINFTSSLPDPVLEHISKSARENAFQQVNIDDEILDQIALEGLSGLTLRRLTCLLDATFLDLNSKSDELSQAYIWTVIVNVFMRKPPGSGIKAFYLDMDRQIIIKEADSRSVLIDKPIKLPNQTVERFTKIESHLHPVQSGNIMGSCTNFLAREDVTKDLVDEFEKEGALESMHRAHLRYGLDNIFFVADQEVRNRALFPNWADPNIDIKLREYCTLELIGKSRTLGIVFPNDKTLGRYRIMLMAKGFITQFQETSSSPIEHLLKRFSHCRASPGVHTITKTVAENGSDEEDNQELMLRSSLFCNPGKLRVNRSTLTTVYDLIASSNGITQLDIRRELNMPKFHLRNHLKNLISLQMVCSYTTRDPECTLRVYRAAHKSSRRKKINFEMEKQTGVMASWDEVDLRAKRIIGHKRSLFTQSEDSLLLLCRITSILIEPNLKLSWCVHKRLVRDLLHDELVESHDKTSDACLRRIKYLRKLPNNIMSINELTAELRDDHEITRLIECNRVGLDEDELNELFMKVLKTVRAKIPSLLGITTLTQRTGLATDSQERAIEIENYDHLRKNYELVDCQSLASISRAPTYEAAKNLVDARFNNACLVTMAYTLTTCFDQKERNNRVDQWLLEKFYSSYPDKLVSSVLSKLNKRSLLTRKCPAEQASLYKPKTKVALKLNQSVLFLLNRYSSSSLMQLANPIGQLYNIDLSESNEMSSIALLTSLCASSSFSLELKLKIPTNVVGIDQGNENFRNLCEKANEGTKEILARFMSRCGGSLASAPNSGAKSANEPSSPEPDEKASALKEVDAKTTGSSINTKMDDSRRALFLLRHELKAQALDKCGSLSDCLIVQPCNVKFYSDKQIEATAKKALDSFLERSKPVDSVLESNQAEQSQQNQTSLLVKSFRLPKDVELSSERDLDASRIPLEYHARLWKKIDGSVHLATLLKLLESLLSWILVFPGAELERLQDEFNHLMPADHLLELLDLMESLGFIESRRDVLSVRKPLLFGYRNLQTSNLTTKVTYEPSCDAYVRYCQFLNYCT